MASDILADIPPEVITSVRWAIAGLDDALQSLRKARYYATIIAGVGKGTVDRELLPKERKAARIKLDGIREDRATLRKFVLLAAENGVDGEAVVRLLREEHKADRRANPSGRYFECRRVIREKEAARLAAWQSTPFPKIGFNAREKRRDYDRRDSGICTKAEIPDPRSLSAREYRWHAARAIRARRAAKAEAERKETALEAIRASLRARGQQTPEREAMAAKIRSARAAARSLFSFGKAVSPAGVRRIYLEAKQRRLAPIEKTAERVAEQLKPYPWFAGVAVEGGAIVILATDLRAAKATAKEVTHVDGKPIVLRKAS